MCLFFRLVELLNIYLSLLYKKTVTAGVSPSHCAKQYKLTILGKHVVFIIISITIIVLFCGGIKIFEIWHLKCSWQVSKKVSHYMSTCVLDKQDVSPRVLQRVVLYVFYRPSWIKASPKCHPACVRVPALVGWSDKEHQSLHQEPDFIQTLHRNTKMINIQDYILLASFSQQRVIDLTVHTVFSSNYEYSPCKWACIALFSPV